MPRKLIGLAILLPAHLLCQSNTGYACAGVSVAFQNSSGGVAAQGVSVAFQNTSGEAATSGLSVAFQNAIDLTGRGVTVAFGKLPPPTQPPPATTSLGATGTTTNRQVSVVEPVNTATGNYYNSPTDLAVPGKGLNFVFARSYNSQDSYSGPMGAGWTHSYNIYLTTDQTSGVVAIKQGDGHQEIGRAHV